MTRVVVGARVLGLAAALGLATTTRTLPDVANSFLLLCAIAALASAPQTLASVRRAVPIIEGAVVGLVLGLHSPANQPLGIYLLLPALVAGLVAGPVLVAAAMLAELATIAAVPVVRIQPELVPVSLQQASPWLITAVGVGLLGSWIRRLREDATGTDHEQYAEANRLLSQLRVVSGRLSSGLDITRLATSLLDECLDLLGDCRGGALLAGKQGAGLVVLADHGIEGELADDQTVKECWLGARLVGRSVQDGSLSSYQRCALPLRVGVRQLGVVVIDSETPLDAKGRSDLTVLLARRALALDTALLFGEVRARACVEERKRLAREIHDGIAQEIASLGYMIDELAATLDPGARGAGVTRVRRELTRIVNDLRLSIFDLRSQVGTTGGVGVVLSDYVRQVGARSGLTVHLSLDEVPRRLRVEVEEELLRITQEAITNARKHSGAANLWVTCRVRPPAAELIIEDDGTGLANQVRVDNFGLDVMRERAQRIGARLEIIERSGGGTRVSVTLPEPPNDRRPRGREGPETSTSPDGWRTDGFGLTWPRRCS